MAQVKSHQCLMQWHKYFPPPTGNTLMHPSSTIHLKPIWNGPHQLTRKLFQGPSLAREVLHHPCIKTPLSTSSLVYPEPGLSAKQLFAFVLFWGDRAYLLWQHTVLLSTLLDHHQSPEPISLRRCLPSEEKRHDSPQCYVSYWLPSDLVKRHKILQGT